MSQKSIEILIGARNNTHQAFAAAASEMQALVLQVAESGHELSSFGQLAANMERQTVQAAAAATSARMGRIDAIMGRSASDWAMRGRTTERNATADALFANGLDENSPTGGGGGGTNIERIGGARVSGVFGFALGSKQAMQGVTLAVDVFRGVADIAAGKWNDLDQVMGKMPFHVGAVYEAFKGLYAVLGWIPDSVNIAKKAQEQTQGMAGGAQALGQLYAIEDKAAKEVRDMTLPPMVASILDIQEEAKKTVSEITAKAMQSGQYRKVPPTWQNDYKGTNELLPPVSKAIADVTAVAEQHVQDAIQKAKDEVDQQQAEVREEYRMKGVGGVEWANRRGENFAKTFAAEAKIADEHQKAVREYYAGAADIRKNAREQIDDLQKGFAAENASRLGGQRLETFSSRFMTSAPGDPTKAAEAQLMMANKFLEAMAEIQKKMEQHLADLVKKTDVPVAVAPI